MPRNFLSADGISEENQFREVEAGSQEGGGIETFPFRRDPSLTVAARRGEVVLGFFFAPQTATGHSELGTGEDLSLYV